MTRDRREMSRLLPSDVNSGLSLLLAMTIELVPAFGLIVLTNYANATDASDGKPRDIKSAGLVIDCLADRIEPAENAETAPESALYAD